MQNWAMTVCNACILAGVIELLVPNAQREKGIKTVLALYILISVLAGTTTCEKDDLLGFEMQSCEPTDFSSYVDEIAVSAIEKELQSKLLEEGVETPVQILRGTEPLVVVTQCEVPQETKIKMQKNFNMILEFEKEEKDS